MSLTILLEPKNHVVLKNKIPFHHTFELAQTPNFENEIDILASYSFPEIELENEYDPEPQFGDLILLPDSIVTLVSSPDFNLFPESILDPVPIHHIESPIFDDHNDWLFNFTMDWHRIQY